MRIGTFCAYVYADHVSNPLERYSNFAKSQIEYALGTNPAGRSYVCGFGNKLPFNPHHRNSHASVTNDINSPATNRHVLFGALVGGPDANDGYADVRTDYVRNEVAMDYNAGFTGAVARLYRESGGFTLNETVTPPAPVTLLRSTLDDFPTGPKTEVEWKALWPGSGGHGSDSEPSPFRSYRHPRRQWNGLARSRRQGRAPLPPAAQHRPEDLDRVNRKRATVA